jgi:hypothetical protein
MSEYPLASSTSKGAKTVVNTPVTVPPFPGPLPPQPSETSTGAKAGASPVGKRVPHAKKLAVHPEIHRMISGSGGGTLSPSNDKRRNKLGYQRTSVACSTFVALFAYHTRSLTIPSLPQATAGGERFAVSRRRLKIRRVAVQTAFD